MIESNKYKFQKLTPCKNAENFSNYEEAFDYIFYKENKDIKNIAITGTYGSGKSSIFNTFEEVNKDKLKFIHISLSHFSEHKIEKLNEPNDYEKIIEGKIINQLIQQINTDKIPLTNFKIKKKSNKRRILGLSITISLLILNVVYLLKYEDIYMYAKGIGDSFARPLLKFLIKPNVLVFFMFIFTVLIFKCIYYIVKLLTERKIIKRISISGNEVEVFDDEKSSYFDKYLNEILYLFENTDVDAVVFEDLDRFNINSIFERLREINTLANIRLQEENKRIVRFFYLIKDDVFISKERTKFFDFIIPIVPIIDSSNSYDRLLNDYENDGYLADLNKDFLSEITFYIDDYRLLKNIFNEYFIYKNNLDNKNLDHNKLLSLIMYKNIYPQDYADLQMNNGIVYRAVMDKEKFIREVEENKESSNHNDLLVYLVRNDYIDKNYSDYISYFYEGSIRLDDKNFILNILNHREPNYGYEIKNIKEVNRRISNKNLQQKAALNYDLVKEIFKNGEPNRIEIICKNIKDNPDFALKYISKKGDKKLAKYINIYIPEFFNDNYDTELFIEDKENTLRYVYDSLIENTEDELSKVNVDSCFTNYISNSNNFLKNSETDLDNFNKNLLFLAIKLENIDLKGINKELLRYVYLNNLYLINKNNLDAVIISQLKEENSKKIYVNLFTRVYRNEENPEHLYSYLYDNREATMTEYLNFYKNQIKDDLSTFTAILNDKEISKDNKERYIKQIDNEIEDINQIVDNEVKTLLVCNKKLVYNISNIVSYYKSKGLDKDLIMFINSKKKEFNFEEINKDDNFNKFINEIVKNNDINNEKYRELAAHYKNWANFSYAELAHEKLEILIDLGVIKLTGNRIEFYRDNYGDYIRLFVEKSSSEYISLVSAYKPSQKELKSILESEKISLDIKEEILIKSVIKPLLNDLNIENDLFSYICEKCLDPTNFTYFNENYTKFDSDRKTIVLKTIKTCISFIKKYLETLSISIIKDLLRLDILNQDEKLLIFKNYINDISPDYLKEILKLLGATKICNNLYKGSNEQVEYNDVNMNIIKCLQDNNLIENAERTDDGQRYKKLKFKTIDK